MQPEFILGMIRITNLLIAVFILSYAFLFLLKTTKRDERRPWDYLFLSALIFLFYQISALIYLFANRPAILIDGNIFAVLLEFLFSGLVLLAFVSQHDLILKSPLILISRKISEEEKHIKNEFKEEARFVGEEVRKVEDEVKKEVKKVEAKVHKPKKTKKKTKSKRKK